MATPTPRRRRQRQLLSPASGNAMGPNSVQIRVDSLGVATEMYRTEHLTAACLLIIALLCLGVMLYTLRSVLIPFLVAVVLMYLLQPIVNMLTTAPRRWCDKCCIRRGERCCESLRHLTRSRRYARYLVGGSDTEMPRRRPIRRNRSWMDRVGLGLGLGRSRQEVVGAEPPVSEPDGERASLLGGRGTRRDATKTRFPAEGARFEDVDDVESEAGSVDLGRSFQGRLTSACTECTHFCLDKIIFPRWLAVVVALSVAVGVLTGLGMAIYSSIVSFNWLKYELGAERLVRRLSRLFALMDLSVNQDLVPFFVDKVKNLTPKVLQGIVDCFSSGVFVLIFLMYLLMAPVRPSGDDTWGEIDNQIRRYIRLKTMICFTVGFLVGIMYWALCVDLAFLWALLTFMLQYVPNVGPIVATFLPMPLVVLDPTLTIPAKIAAFALPGLVHAIIGNIMEPRLFGSQFELHPVMVLIALAFWSALWGVPGMVLSVPLMAVTRIICEDLEHPYAHAAVRIMEGKIGPTAGPSSSNFAEADSSGVGSPFPSSGTLSQGVESTTLHLSASTGNLSQGGAPLTYIETGDSASGDSLAASVNAGGGNLV